MIQINHVTKKYGNNVILEQASYTFPQTGIVCLMGASGGGKTTLLNLLAGFDTDYEGEILVGGKALNHMNADKLCDYRKDNVGFIFQNYHLLQGYTVLENVMLASELTEKDPTISLQKAKSLLSRLHIETKETQKIENLSGGQKQRVAIARALMRNPQILFADEPTGALDRSTSTEIMELLREVARDRLVIVITHDQKICDFADKVIHIQDKKIVTEQSDGPLIEKEIPLKNSPYFKTSFFPRGLKNFKVHFKRYLAVSLAISIGVLAFLFSLSFENVIERSIEDFKQKNTAFNNGFIKGEDDGTVLNYLKSDERIDNVYYQYKLNNVTLSVNEKVEIMVEKFPTPKTGEGISYGTMPRQEKNEISLTPSLAKKFNSNINSLIGKELTLDYENRQYKLVISGIYNAGYDDFIISSDIEQKLYRDMPEQSNYSISYDVRDFSDIVKVSNTLKLQGLDTKNAADEVNAFQNTFQSLNKLFSVISILILAMSLFICTVLLIKLQNTRYHEIGLLSALGFNQRQITTMIFVENTLLSALATIVNLSLLACSVFISNLMVFPLIITSVEIILSVIATFAVVMLISFIASYKLIRTEPATALRN